jgi:hypothetical protein
MTLVEPHFQTRRERALRNHSEVVGTFWHVYR